ncbi:hypothetical protein GJ629_10130 [Halapricum sp. CBA1109]|uniref:antitoxin VapB family protein n=1 Tax=Halapricum sp. CBA1109 TaxID=2668068 RepID=UPI0012F81DDD|nr:antitoxin VapB family protein [Halapricum sp. CBA1109]MUV90200.1 hypothetical protein [Halapricum sp. CBA1109]
MSHQVRLDDDVYERIKSEKREGETFSDTIERLTEDYGLLDLADADGSIDRDTFEEAQKTAKEAEREDAEKLAEKMSREENTAQ